MARRRARRVERTKEEIKIIVEKQSGKCAYCQRGINHNNCIIEQKMSTGIWSKDDESMKRALIQYRTKKVAELGSNKDGKPKPAYLVLNNLTIDYIVNDKPKDKNSFLGVNGLGPQKYKNYGEDILKIVRKHSPEGSEELVGGKLLQAICQSCDTSKKQSIRIPEGQMEKVDDYDLPNAEVIRLALAEFLGNRMPESGDEIGMPSNVEKHLVIRERDMAIVKTIYM